MPHWEFQAYLESFHRDEARGILNQTQAIGLALGGKNSSRSFKKLEKIAGYTKKPVKPKIKVGETWLDGLLKML